MSAIRRLPRISVLLGVVSLAVALASKSSLRVKVGSLLGLTSPGGIWRLLAITLAVLNLKNLPLVWHVRTAASFATNICQLTMNNRSDCFAASSITSSSNPHRCRLALYSRPSSHQHTRHFLKQTTTFTSQTVHTLQISILLEHILSPPLRATRCIQWAMARAQRKVT